jgi:hypothetical protein
MELIDHAVAHFQVKEAIDVSEEEANSGIVEDE